jgi:hypothetical protein
LLNLGEVSADKNFALLIIKEEVKLIQFNLLKSLIRH